ncbi:type IV pilus modification protein PilV [Ramlibacter alkalitolerans]|uniref:Type IV pilus modification protein PilV n=1 Tax=Ramlibacter alkalitolerans TaxID=2039631 RepID=A0ABS1JNW0_9BURK|nr:type IV pilus modification protein PilV [Ramlibacter alkalitolerans]MBL0425898.1 type IV pilus modification protein PilV [Ramlibacter alkalitolerans]
MRLNRTPPSPRRRRHAQRGIMLLEALIAILIFTVGILGLVGLQASAVKQSTDASYRAEAAQLADQLIGKMWADNRAVTNLQTRYNTCTSSACPGYIEWMATVANTLPGVTITSSTTRPDVSVNGQGIVTISIFWRAPQDEGSAPHRYDVEAQISE